MLNSSGMQQNEFEKQVKSMMDAFTPHPSEAVWKNVSSRLNTGKRKKPWFVFWLFALLMISAGGALLYNFSTSGNNVGDDVGREEAAMVDSAQTDKPLVQKDAAPQPIETPSEETSFNSLHKKNSEVVSPGYKKPGLKNRAYHSLPDNTARQEPALNASLNSQNNFLSQQINTANTPDANNAFDQPVLATIQNSFADSLAIVKTEPVTSDVLSVDSVATFSNKQQDSAASSSPIKIQKKYTLPQWQLGFTAAYGSSNAVNNFINDNKAATDYQMVPGNGTSVDTGYHNAYPYTAGHAYKLGFVAEKRIMKNGFIAAGLSYTYLSTKSSVGKNIDSLYTLTSNALTVNGYYKPGNASTYTNQYHFIEIPVYFQQDLFPEKKLSLSYNAGFSLRQLLSSQSLVYDSHNNIYFSMNDQLAKTQIQLQAAVNAKFNAGKNIAIYLGPQFSYSLTGLYKNGSNGNFHFIDYGLQLGVMFRK